jgi:alpha-ketoglutarate-dependent taurine dioxygenase
VRPIETGTAKRASAALVGALGPDVRTNMPFADNPPLVVEPVGGTLAHEPRALISWFAGHATVFDGLLAVHGAVLLRGFPVEGSQGFDDLVSHYPAHSSGYSGGATPRDRLGRNVYEATQVPAEIDIKLHQEMAYLREYPAKLAFFCHVPASSGGETIIGDMRRFMQMLDGRFLKQLESHGVVYHRNFRPADQPHPADAHPRIYHATFRQGFGTDDHEHIQQQCSQLGMEFEWMPDGSLSTRLYREAFATHPLGGDRVYFNHILTQIMNPQWLGPTYEAYLDIYDRGGRARPYHVTYGDGSEVDWQDYLSVERGVGSIEVCFPWQPGDVMIVDNVYTAHGRRPYTGSRDIQVALID